jgi:hypothetical protein
MSDPVTCRENYCREGQSRQESKELIGSFGIMTSEWKTLKAEVYINFSENSKYSNRAICESGNGRLQPP